MATVKKQTQPTEILEHEHDVILLVLEAAAREADYIQSSGKVRTERIEKIVDFIRNFADRCHHAKEECLLFERMRQRGFSMETGPLAVMMMEHDEGRRNVASILTALPEARAGKASAVTMVEQNLRSYIGLLRRHIAKENQVLYPMANQVLSETDQVELLAAFERVEKQEMGPGTHEKYHQLAHELQQE